MNAILALLTFLRFLFPLKNSEFYHELKSPCPLPCLHNDDSHLFHHDLLYRAHEHNHCRDDDEKDVSKRVVSCVSHVPADTFPRSKS